MPLVRIEIIKGNSTVYKKKLLDTVHTGLINALGIDDSDRYQRLYELNREDFETGPDKTDQFIMIEITMFPGRTKEQKANVYQEITKGLERELGISPKDVFIVIQDPPVENWGLGGKQRQ